MYVLAGVWGVTTVLPVVEPHIQYHYFTDASHMYSLLQAYLLFDPKISVLAVFLNL